MYSKLCKIFIGLLLLSTIFSNDSHIQAEADMRAVVQQEGTEVYEEKDNKFTVLQEYEVGDIIQYKQDSEDSEWLVVNLDNDESTEGYIHSENVDVVSDERASFEGAAVDGEVQVFNKPSSNGDVIKTIIQGSVLEVQTFVSGWYEINVDVEGEQIKGYISQGTIEIAGDDQVSLSGIAQQNQTHVYSQVSGSSDVIKSYPKGSKLLYRSFLSGWYEAIVYVDGTKHTGYISQNDVEEPVEKQASLTGVALGKTSVYSSTNKNSSEIKNYSKGSILKYKTFIEGWYEATVFVDGVKYTGYIHSGDVEEPTSNPKSLSGVGTKQKTKVYAKASESSSVLKDYGQGSTLKYKTFINDWYAAEVILDGKRHTGYIHVNDVQEPTNDPVSLKGVALKNKTNVYVSANKDSRVLKDYSQGSTLKYKTFIDGWYQARVILDGEAQTGYIAASDVEQPVEDSENLRGVSVNSSTKVYVRPSKTSSALKSYNAGKVLYYETYLNNWHVAEVILNGKRQTGYIHEKDVEEPVAEQKKSSGYALKSETEIYSNPTKDSNAIKSYEQGQLLYYKTFLNNWYEATVYTNGKKRTGYIYAGDVEEPIKDQENLKGYSYHSKINVYSAPSKRQTVLKSYGEGRLLKYKSFMDDWYEAEIIVNGNRKTGFIHKNDVIDQNASQESFDGMAYRDETFVYSATSRDSKKLKGYSFGSRMVYKTFTSNWYEATVYVEGKKRTGYIHKNDVINAMKDLGPIVNPKSVYSYNQMVKDINKLKNAYSGIIRTEVIGQSLQGRDIHVVKIGNGDKKITINASHHAREWISTNLVMNQIDEYSRAYVNGSKIDGYNVRDILEKVTIYYVPMVNPDGVTLNQFGPDGFSNRSQLIRLNNGSTDFTSWKANARGVDLNRQYPADWENITKVASNPGPYNYKGTNPLTEPEVKALYNFTKNNNFESHVAYHSSGEVLYWAYNSTGKKREEYRQLADKVSNKTGYSLVHPSSNPSGGGYTDWVIDSIQKPGLTPELSRHVGSRPVPLSNYERIWRQNDSVGLMLAKEALN
ncbi:hypothetical protein CEY16_07775 [Halalkalibacillus sediminis]|uniref:Peptidase M14 domain-containing protein n=1 Tax=Halalkalibacillus sediminis TaxID=2018042 RepID=A0A2I0QU32_9BACI|nr:M14 family metallocarboxypeptidase [Halalkalibacillus sediminis]PKR77819.1 hypothetical protein CEY16_07775 [Halalkalibacillus sediminis]